MPKFDVRAELKTGGTIANIIDAKDEIEAINKFFKIRKITFRDYVSNTLISNLIFSE